MSVLRCIVKWSVEFDISAVQVSLFSYKEFNYSRVAFDTGQMQRSFLERSPGVNIRQLTVIQHHHTYIIKPHISRYM
jgi:hypothetical protein